MAWAQATQALNFIEGKTRESISGDRLEVVAPATGKCIGSAARSGEADVAAAAAAASKGAREWRAMGQAERRQRMYAWASAIRERAAHLALVDAIDSGIPLRTMRAGILKGAEYVEYFAGLALEARGETIPATPGNLHYTVHEPYGVVGVVIPFNHPAYFSMSKTAPALAAGNAVILKPSELTPLTATLVAEAGAECLPPGVFNVVQGGADVGAAIVKHPDVARLHFTGGVPTGLAVQRMAAESGRVKRVSLELGGKNALIAFPDADPHEVAAAAFTGSNFTRNQGQSCGSTSRLLVHRDIAENVTALIREQVEKIRIGLPEDDETEMGSLVSVHHQQRVLAHINQGRAEGARLVTGGGPVSGELAAGAFVQPTVFDQVSPNMTIAREEIFGPVMCVMDWDNEATMRELVNATDYGLTAAIFTNDITTALRTASAIEAGYVWINGVETRWKGVPFGGQKNSGIGNEHSRAELETYLRLKAVNVML